MQVPLREQRGNQSESEALHSWLKKSDFEGFVVIVAQFTSLQLCNEFTSVSPTCCSALRRCKVSIFLISNNTKYILIFFPSASTKRDINKVTRLHTRCLIE